MKLTMKGEYLVLLYTGPNGEYDTRCRNDVDVRKFDGKAHFETIADNTVLYTGHGNHRVYHVVFRGPSNIAKKVKMSLELTLEGAGSVRDRLSVSEEA
jgi:hypothetical protein